LTRASISEQARADITAGNHKRAVRRLWEVEASARTDAGSARGLLELASDLAARTDGKVRRECETLAGHAENMLTVHANDRAADALVWIPRCRFLAGAGLPIAPTNGSRWDLIFREDGVVLRGS